LVVQEHPSFNNLKKAGIVVKEKPVSKNKRKTDSLNLSISSSGWQTKKAGLSL
jgi:hypothetical protein